MIGPKLFDSVCSKYESDLLSILLYVVVLCEGGGMCILAAGDVKGAPLNLLQARSASENVKCQESAEPDANFQCR